MSTAENISSPISAAPEFAAESSRLLYEKIKTRQAVVGVIGLGYVGLPLAARSAETGFPVLGFDTDKNKVDRISEGKSYIGHIPSELIERYTSTRRLEATSDFSRLAEADCIIICVPTPLTAHREPDLSYIEATAASIAKALRPGQLICLESTTYPGTTQEILVPAFEKAGFKTGTDIHVVFSPERENPGNGRLALHEIPKIVGGVTESCRHIGAAFYGQIVRQVVPVSSTQVAEMAKLLENIFRCVNIALVNELKILCDRMGIDVWEVIQAASTKPFGFMPFYPGPGLGGHCIPIDPFYLTWKAREYDVTTRFIELAGEINSMMPYYVVTKMVEALNRAGKSVRGAKILVLGLSYKRDVGDIRESPSLKIMELLFGHGASVLYHDPHVPSFGNLRHYSFAMESVPLSRELLEEVDVVLIATDHSSINYGWVAENAQLVVDTRNAIPPQTGGNKIVRA